MRTQRNQGLQGSGWLSQAGQTASRFSRHGTNYGSSFLGFWRGLWWRARHSSFATLKPGWLILIGLLALYALWATFALIGAQRELARARVKPAASATRTTVPSSTTTSTTASSSTQSSRVGQVLTWPLEGARMPRSVSNTPGAKRTYRNGRSQGFTFTGGDSGLRVRYGMPVRAAADGQIIRSDLTYNELSEAAYRKLLRDVRNGASKTQLDALRGRQIYIKHSDGRITRYGHLSKISPELGLGGVKRGQVVGYVGNSGTLEGARGTRLNARLQFEIWLSESRFLGQDMTSAQVRAAANGVFK
jgi:peptidoglycan LD-endopeptidase LytH